MEAIGPESQIGRCCLDPWSNSKGMNEPHDEITIPCEHAQASFVFSTSEAKLFLFRLPLLRLNLINACLGPTEPSKKTGNTMHVKRGRRYSQPQDRPLVALFACAEGTPVRGSWIRCDAVAGAGAA
jgi:hypothetical protein